MTEISLASTQELIDELKSRHDGMIFCGVNFLDIKGKHDIKHFVHGNKFVCGFLANMLSTMIYNSEISALSQQKES